MVDKVAEASRYRENYKKPEKHILLGDSKECLHPLCATVQIRIFLGVSDLCYIWIPIISLLDNPSYEGTKGGGQKPMV
jgi:hypothetical protein